MTRFARAKGSKASNERVPESTTPWSTMKTDLQKSQEEAKNQKHRKKFEEERQKNYDEFVKETDSKVEKKWAEFPKPNLKTIKKNKNQFKKFTEKDVTDDMIEEMCQPDPEVDGKLNNMTKKIEQVLVKENVNKKQNKMNKSVNNDDDDAPEEASTKDSPKKLQIKKPKNKKQVLKIASVKTAENAGEPEIKTGKKQTQKNGENKQGKFNKNGKQHPKPNERNNGNKKFNKNQKPLQKPKERDNLPHERRKPFTTDKTIKVNGEEKQIVRYEGFPILETDRDRLVALRKSLISKGIPRFEVSKTIKWERRKAEKALSLLRKKVCYQCRASGHVLSDCPELGDKTSLVDNAGTGVCFKCGSGEHTHKECKVSKEYSFAKCFICKEQGHISSQCPDNPRGLYPKGGACNLCGEVTHLKKDCPKHIEEQKSTAMFLDTISSGNFEGIEDVEPPKKKKSSPKKKKVVKF